MSYEYHGGALPRVPWPLFRQRRGLGATGVDALVEAMSSGAFSPQYEPGTLTITCGTRAGEVVQAPNQMYLSDASAAQLAALVGGSVVKTNPIPGEGCQTLSPANLVQLPDGRTLNAGDLASYAHLAYLGPAQLQADLTQEINQGAAIQANYLNPSSPVPDIVPYEIGPPVPVYAGQPKSTISLPSAPPNSLAPSGAPQQPLAASGNSAAAAIATATVTAGATSSWFTDSMFGGIPNWGLLAAAGIAAFLVLGGGHGR